MARYGCQEHVAEDVYHMDFGARPCYAVETSSACAAHDGDVPDLDLNLDTMADVLS
jgi:hypothetical protein